jgi:uncharacterized membrane protein
MTDAIARHAFITHRLQQVTCISLVILILLCVHWEIWLAPLKPGGTWLAAKALPLFLLLPGLFKGRRYTYQVATLVALLYLLEGSVRAASDTGVSQWLGWLETLLALVFFLCATFYARLSAPGRKSGSTAGATHLE